MKLIAINDDVLNELRRRQIVYSGMKVGFVTKERSITIDWMMHVCYYMRLCRETFHTSVYYFDTFLHRTKNFEKYEKYQLYGCTAMWLATKIHEAGVYTVTAFSDQTDETCTSNEVISMECKMVIVLDWDLHPVTCADWVYVMFGLNSDFEYSIERVMSICDCIVLMKPNLNPYDIARSSISALQSKCFTKLSAFARVIVKSLKHRIRFGRCFEQFYSSQYLNMFNNNMRYIAIRL